MKIITLMTIKKYYVQALHIKVFMTKKGENTMGIYLITGGAGFIGCNFIKYILEKYNNEIQIINVDKLNYAGDLTNLQDINNNKNYRFIKGDICNKSLIKQVFDKYKPDYIVNFAAESHVDRSIKQADIFVKTNILGTQNLLEQSLNTGVKKFHQVSTDEAYGSLGEEGFFTEDTPLNPHSPYAASKASADFLVKAYFDTHNLPINITRCSNNYGPNQFPEKLIPLTINKTIQHKKIPVYGTGKNVRDWLFVEDHCAAIDIVIKKSIPGKVYNIGGNSEMRNIDVVKKIIKLLRELTNDEKISEELIKYVEDRKGHDWRYAIDASLIKKELQWSPKICFEDGIYKTVKWYVDNKSWVDKKSIKRGDKI